MPAAPETLSATIGRRFWTIWEKAFYLIAAVLFALIYWASETYGGVAIVRAGCGLFGVAGVACLVHAWRSSLRAQASKGWRPVPARIVSAEVASEQSRPTYRSHQISTVGPITYYYPRVSYEYDVEGLTYRSSRIILVNVNYSPADAHALVARYAAGARVTAWVDPGDPRTAVLETGLAGRSREYAIPAIVGGVFTVFGAAGWYLVPRFLK